MTSDLKSIQKELRQMSVKIAKSDSRAKNKALSRMRTEVRRAIQRKYNIKAKDINKTISTQKATPKNLESHIKLKSFTTPIVAPILRTTKIPKGRRKKNGAFKTQNLKVLIKVGAPKYLVGNPDRKPFLMRASASSSKMLVMERKYNNKRLPLKRVNTIPIANMPRTEEIQQHIETIGSDAYNKEFERLMELE